MRFVNRRRDEQGSIAITVMVSMIATAVTAALLTTVYRDITVSRRAGDSANALQVADAGLNDAVKSLRNAVAVMDGCPQKPGVAAFSRTSTLAGGTYTYCAFPDQDATGRPTWHIDATATDATGVQRRLRAQAVSEPLFPNAINVIASGSFSSGFSVDSFKNETSRCTKKGLIGTNSPNTFTFGNNGNNSSENCQNTPNGTFPHPPDGCVAYSTDGSAAIPSANVGPGQCPPTFTTTASPKYVPPAVSSPARFDYPASSTTYGANFTCSSATLDAGKVYYYNSVTLAENCGFPAAGPFPSMGNPTKIYTNSLTILGGSGSSTLNPINQPPNNATVCGPTHGVTGSNPLYCPGWAGGLQIFVNGGQVKFSGNHSTFWGVITAPSSTVTWSGGGASQWEIFGSMVANSVTGAVQAKWHYDENLGSLTSGRFFAQNWREEGLNR